LEPFSKEHSIQINFKHLLNEPQNIPLLDQDKNYKYVIYAEGNCGWADRLKMLLHLRMAIIMQDTPCIEYYALFIKPFVHYLPVDSTFDNLTDTIRWAEANDNKIRKMVTDAQDLARNILSINGMKYYFKALIKRYASLLKYKVTRRPGSMLYIKSVYNCDRLLCTDEGSFIKPNVTDIR